MCAHCAAALLNYFLTWTTGTRAIQKIDVQYPTKDMQQSMIKVFTVSVWTADVRQPANLVKVIYSRVVVARRKAFTMVLTLLITMWICWPGKQDPKCNTCQSISYFWITHYCQEVCRNCNML